MSSDNFEYSERYYDAEYEYRHVVLPKSFVKRIPAQRLMRENEWRALGVMQSAGWMHYAIHKPERHILLFKRPRGYGELARSERLKWDRQVPTLLEACNAEIQGPAAARARNMGRQILRETHSGFYGINNKENQPAVPSIADLFY